MNSSRIRTIYLLPHSHTDIGYTHDPLVMWELHDRFIDQAIHFCEETAGAPPDNEPFRWTIEVFAVLDHWLAHRDDTWHERLRHCLMQNQWRGPLAGVVQNVRLGPFSSRIMRHFGSND